MTDAPSPRVLLTEEAIGARVRELALEVRRDSGPDAPLHLVAALKGAFVFMADFARALTGTVTCDFLSVGSYDGRRETSGQIRITQDIEQSIEAARRFLDETKENAPLIDEAVSDQQSAGNVTATSR